MSGDPNTGSRAATLPGRCLDAITYLGLQPLRSLADTVRRILAFALIVLATTLTKFGRSRSVVHPLLWDQVRLAGVRLLPFVGFLAVAAGFVLVSQAAQLLRQFGADTMLGPILAATLVREIAPLATALLVLLRVGTATVVELATIRATGEIEALEALHIDPIHYLVMPRVLGMAIAVFCLAVYFLLGSLASGYLFCFLQQLPIAPGDYLDQISLALRWQDFPILLLKTSSFGAAIAVITCYRGLAQPLRLGQVPDATTRAVTESVVVCVALDALFLGVHLLD